MNFMQMSRSLRSFLFMWRLVRQSLSGLEHRHEVSATPRSYEAVLDHFRTVRAKVGQKFDRRTGMAAVRKVVLQDIPNSPGWTRTNNPPVNSRMLCQLSYRGTALGRKPILAAG
jgi:hypothetical protein